MGFGIGEVISLGSAATPILGDILQFTGAREQRSAQEQLLNRQLDWQGYMSNTAHQREVADLRAAGLNPILSAGGGGASSPGAPGYTPQNLFEDASSSARELVRTVSEVQALRAGLAETKSKTELNKENAELLRETQRRTQLESSILAQAVPGAKNVGDVQKKLGETGGWAKFLAPFLSSAADFAKGFFKR